MGWGDPKGPRPFDVTPAAVVGTTGQIEEARHRFHEIGVVGNNLAEEAMIAERLLARVVNEGGLSLGVLTPRTRARRPVESP